MKFTLSAKDDNVAYIDSNDDIVPERSAVREHPIEKLLGIGCYSHKVLLNLEHAKYISSEGVAWLLRCHQNFEQGGGKLIIHSVTPTVDRVLKLLNLNRVFHLAADQANAKAQLPESES